MAPQIKKILAYLWHVPYWVFLVVFIVSGYISIVALRHNNETMISLRSAVYAADKNGSNIETALDNLRGYVYGHMNTNLSSGGNAIKPPIQLKYTYERLQATAKQRTETANAQVTIDAQNYCVAQNPGSDAATKSRRFDCARDYLSSHTAQSSTVPTALYEYDFISPSWSPDLAGWSLLATVFFFILFVISFALERLVRIRLRAQDI
jgi:preprotein translocase subunit SecF